MGRSHASAASPWGSFAEAMFCRVRSLRQATQLTASGGSGGGANTGAPRSPFAPRRSGGRRRAFAGDLELGGMAVDEAAVRLPAPG